MILRTAKTRFTASFVGAALTVVVGLGLWSFPLGERWVNASYDYIFRFGSRPVTNRVALVLMDNDAYAHYGHVRGQWDRASHAELLNRLTVDGSSLVVFDTIFREEKDSAKDAALAEAMRRHGRVVLMAKQAEGTHPGMDSVRPVLPAGRFLAAAQTNWGVAFLAPDLDLIVRRHWPFPSPGPHPSLPETAARLAGTSLSDYPQERWLRFYGQEGGWTKVSYRFALTRATNYFRDKIVFIGNKPATSVPDGEEDEFRTPYTRWTDESASGVEILTTMFLNLVNGDWLRRPPSWVEALILVLAGTTIGLGLCHVGAGLAVALAAAVAVAVALGTVTISYFTDYWFPSLVISGGQVPCALGWALLSARLGRAARVDSATEVVSAVSSRDSEPPVPDTPDYELIQPHFGKGGFGRVWLARNAIGQWQALKAVYLANFAAGARAYETEFKGIQRYKPISDRHPGLLRVDFVSRPKRVKRGAKQEEYFYYVMELGDALMPDWEKNPTSYRPRDLAGACAGAEPHRLPVNECVSIGLRLAEALHFLHRQGLTHRDIKPSNIVFVNGQPKLADVGLVTEIRPPDLVTTWAGTVDYMPPPPEPPGTVPADVYALGKVLFVISTGRGPKEFPDLPESLVEESSSGDFLLLNGVICKACQSDPGQRFASAEEMRVALQEAQRWLESNAAKPML